MDRPKRELRPLKRYGEWIDGKDASSSRIRADLRTSHQSHADRQWDIEDILEYNAFGCRDDLYGFKAVQAISFVVVKVETDNAAYAQYFVDLYGFIRRW